MAKAATAHKSKPFAPVPMMPDRPAYYVYSTSTCGSEFVQWEPNASKDLYIKKYSVHIAGGAGVARRTGLITPLGVRTAITQKQHDFLMTDPMFLRHIEDGWYTVIKASGWTDDADVVAADMQQRDGSAPLVPGDYVQDKQPATGGADGLKNRPSTYRPRTNPLPMVHGAFR